MGAIEFSSGRDEDALSLEEWTTSLGFSDLFDIAGGMSE
jgi:hypothetical protein